jgi:hypothetical protein
MVLHATLGFQEVQIWVLEENSSVVMSNITAAILAIAVSVVV